MTRRFAGYQINCKWTRQTNEFGTHVRLTAHWFLPTEMAEGRRGIIGVMTDVTQILSQIESGDPSAAEQLLPLVYEELRKLAAAKLAQEKPGQTLQATALVHEAYLRLVDVEQGPALEQSRPFLCRRRRSDAADSRRTSAAQTTRSKHGGGLQRIDLDSHAPAFR